MNKKKKEIEFEQPSEFLLLANRYVVFVMAFIILVILSASYFFLLKPKIDSISVVNLENTEELDRKLRNELLLTKLKELEVEYKDIMNNRQEDLDLLKKVVPHGTQTAELFVISDQLAKKHNFQLLNISINESAPEEARSTSRVDDLVAQSDDAISEEPLITSIDDLLAMTDIKATVVDLSVSKTILEGNEMTGEEVYKEFKDYISELENSIRLLDIQAVGFSEIAAEGMASYIFNLDLITYHQ